MSTERTDVGATGDWFRELAERSGDFFFRLRLAPTRAFEFVGDQIELAIGYPASAFYADADLAERLVNPTDLAVLNEHFSRHGTGDFDLELRWRHRDGHTVWTHVWAKRRVGPDGSMALDGIARDLTALRTTQSALEADRYMYRMLAETMKDVVWVYDVDADRFVYVSPSVTPLSGARPEDLVGRSIAETSDPQTAQVFASMLAADRSRIGDGTHGEFETVQFEQPRLDGTVVWTEATGHYVRNATTGHLELWAASRDITARRQVLSALAESEHRYRMLAENASDAVLVRDLTGVIEWSSPSISTVLGWAPADLIGRDTLDFVHPDDAGVILRMRAEVGAGVPTAGLIIRAWHADGAFRYLSVSSHDLTDAAGVVTGAVVGLRNVDELVRERQRAERSEALVRATLDARRVPQTLVSAVRGEDGGIIDFAYVQANRSAWESVGLTEDQFLTSTLLAVAPGRVDTWLFFALVRAVESGEALVLRDTPLTARDGTVRRFDISAAPVDDGLTIDWADETERHTARQRLAESELRYRLLAENTMDVIVHYRDGVVAWVSPALTEALGWLPADWEGGTIEAYLHPDDIDAHERNARILLSGKPVVARYRLRSVRGVYHWVETHARPFVDERGDDAGVVASFRTIDLEVHAEEELERRARYDDLTGLLKRDEAIARLSVRDGRRDPGRRRAVLFVDLDDFKQVNDTHGHHTGDVVLRTLAHRLRAAVRDADPVARMGGDEFVVILDGVHDIAEAHLVAEKVLGSMADPVVVDGSAVTVTASVGVTLLNPDETADDVLARADRAMYQAKRTGRNRVLSLPDHA